jgi:hypothetical protein
MMPVRTRMLDPRCARGADAGEAAVTTAILRRGLFVASTLALLVGCDESQVVHEPSFSLERMQEQPRLDPFDPSMSSSPPRSPLRAASGRPFPGLSSRARSALRGRLALRDDLRGVPRRPRRRRLGRRRQDDPATAPLAPRAARPRPLRRAAERGHRPRLRSHAALRKRAPRGGAMGNRSVRPRAPDRTRGRREDAARAARRGPDPGSPMRRPILVPLVAAGVALALGLDAGRRRSRSARSSRTPPGSTSPSRLRSARSSSS